MEKDGGIKHSMNEHGVIFKSAMSVIAIGTNSVSQIVFHVKAHLFPYICIIVTDTNLLQCSMCNSPPPASTHISPSKKTLELKISPGLIILGVLQYYFYYLLPPAPQSSIGPGERSIMSLWF